MGQLCDDDCTVVLRKHDLSVIKNEEIIIRGTRNRTDDLWDIPIRKRTRTTVKKNITADNFQNPLTHPGMYESRQINNLLKNNIFNGHNITAPIQKIRPPKPRPPSTAPHHIENVSIKRCAHLVHVQHDEDIKMAKRYCVAALPQSDKKLAVIIRKKETHRDLARYLHASCFSPVHSTWTRAIKNRHFQSWPGLTQQLVDKHLPLSTATVRGHLHKQRQNLQSTKGIKKHKLIDEKSTLELHDNFPASPDPNVKSNRVAYVVIDKKELSTGYQDLTGRFPVRSTQGNEYVLVGYHYDANCILGHPVKNRSAQTLTAAWEHLHKEFSKAGTAPDVWVLDNECSNELKRAFERHNVEFQLVPPHEHRRNLAERAIQTWKNHFKAGLASTDPKFPLSEWDRLIPQANITLNLLRSARANPSLSAHAYIYGMFDFSATPLAPPGTKVVVHLHPSKRGAWELNGDTGWYVGPALDHYRCVECYFPRTRTTRVCETVTFFPHEVPFPKVTITDHLRQAATDIVTILTKPPSTTTPSLQAGDPIRNALLEIAQQLNRVEDIATINHPHDKQPTRVAEVNKDHHAALPRVEEQPTRVAEGNKDHHAALPRVEKRQSPTASAFKQRSTLPKRVRFRSASTHKYSLRPRSTNVNYGTNFRHLAVQYITAQDMFHLHVNHIYRPDGKKETIDTLLQGSDRDIWMQSLSNEWGRLAQSNDKGVIATDTIDFIHRHEVPDGRDVTYATFVLNYRPLKSETHRVRITVGGDRLSYAADAGSPAANLLETKLLVNSTISDASKGARFMSTDLKDFFLATPMEENEYMRVNYKHFPDDIKKRYNLDDKATPSGHIFIKIKRGMYGLKQAAILAYEHLKENLAKYGYSPVQGTVGLWQHETRPTKFCVCVDDFGIKYYSKDDAQHLIDSLEKHYTCTKDWEGKNYCGLTFDWHYDDGYVDVSMPKYVPESLQRLRYVKNKYPQYSPHHHAPIQYGQKGTRQFASSPDDSPLLSPKETKHVQSTTGSFLYYGRAIDYTILPALNDIASAQAKPTQKTKEKTQQLMDYLHTYPNAFIRFYASDMVLHVDSDAAYLVAPKARSRIAGYFHLSNHPNITKHPKLNGAVLVECKTLRHVVSSSAEAEVAGIFHNAGMAIPIRHILQALNHPQPPTPLKTDNSTAAGFVYDNIHQKRSKSWDMRYHWLRDKQTQQQFNIFWEKGVNNDADYFTKHHPIFHHLAQRAKYVQDKLRECLHILSPARVS